MNELKAFDIVQHFLINFAHTVATREFAKHMALYARDVELFGVPGRAVLGFDDIAMRRQTEFEKGLLLRVAFEDLDVVRFDKSLIVFRVQETMKSTDGQALILDTEVTLRCEADHQWRIQEKHITKGRLHVDRGE